MSDKRTAPNQSFKQSMQFIGHFLSWYQESFGQSDAYNHIKLIDLVKEAEDIHTLRIRELDEELTENIKSNTTITSKKQLVKRKRISKFL